MTAPLSTASTGATPAPANSPSLTLADLTPPSTDPNLSINAKTQTGRLQFPTDRPAYYFQIDLAKYDRSSWATAGTISTQLSIVLPFPVTIIDSQQIQWDEVPLGIFGAGALNIARGNIGGSLSEITQNALKNIAGGALAVGAQAAGEVGSGFLAAAGVAVNQFLTMMLKGPSYRELDFSWTFSPRTAQESEVLTNIIALINDAAAPSLLGATSAFFGYPYIFNCSFHFNNALLGGTHTGYSMLYNFKPAVVRNRAWNYTPAGQPVHFAGTRAPAIIEFHLKLVELEFWLQGQYGSGLAVNQGTGFSQGIQDFFKTVGAASAAAATGGGTSNPVTTNPSDRSFG